MIGRVVKESPACPSRSYGEAVNLPRPMPVFTLNPSKLKRTCGPRVTLDQSPGAVFHLVPADSHPNPLPFISCSDFEECRLEIQLLSSIGLGPPMR